MGLSVADEEPIEEEKEPVIDSIRSTLSDEPLIMNAIRDDETGEMVATDIINASRVVARFRNVAERAGYVSIGFDVIVPEQMYDSKWQLRISPYMTIKDERTPLESVYVTGSKYRAAQMRGYERYRRFISSIITDTTKFIRLGQLEIFLKRNFPETYAMKNDSSIVSEPMAENLFGVTQQEALRHYTDKMGVRQNENRKARSGKMYKRFVKDPIVSEGIRLDTVMQSNDGDFVYRYIHTFRSEPGLRKVSISLTGVLCENGVEVAPMTFPEDITFYISSLSSLSDDRPKYRMIVLERKVFDNTKALIDFSVASFVVDTTLGDNASELARVRRCIDDVSERTEYALDSLVIIASCSPEGSFALNKKLSLNRSEAVRKYIAEYVSESWRDSLKISSMPENWDQLIKLVGSDTLLTDDVKKKILEYSEISSSNPDRAEAMISKLPQYRYLREKIYPKLRSVRFDFHLHRVGMQKDTVHTTELDTVYMSGLQALKDLDYKKAVSILRPYDDYNAALAFMSADYNHSALDVLNRLDDTDARVCYLKAMVLSRLGLIDEALKYFTLSLAYEPSLQYRANLDPEMFRVVNKYKSINQNKDEF
jgi:tetratricopeptide (TPR) repeat protein